MTEQVVSTNYKAPAQLLRGHNILVSGAGAGIGKTAAETFAAHGATVILLGRTLSKLEQVHDRIVSAGHPQPLLFELDMLSAEPGDYRELGDAVMAQPGCLHGLLNNAGLLGERSPLANAGLPAWREVMEVNVTAQMLLTQALLPALHAAGQASVIFTSSSVGRRGRAYWGAYAVSKFATEGLMQVLAEELENTSEIRVNSLNPGATRTAMRAAAYPAENPSTLPTPAQLMPAYLYLMGKDSARLHGQALSVRVEDSANSSGEQK